MTQSESTAQSDSGVRLSALWPPRTPKNRRSLEAIQEITGSFVVTYGTIAAEYADPNDHAQRRCISCRTDGPNPITS